MRNQTDAGRRRNGPIGPLGGTGGSSTPIPVNFRGGPPECAEEVWGSSSKESSVNSYGMAKMLFQQSAHV